MYQLSFRHDVTDRNGRITVFKIQKLKINFFSVFGCYFGYSFKLIKKEITKQYKNNIF